MFFFKGDENVLKLDHGNLISSTRTHNFLRNSAPFPAERRLTADRLAQTQNSELVPYRRQVALGKLAAAGGLASKKA